MASSSAYTLLSQRGPRHPSMSRTQIETTLRHTQQTPRPPRPRGAVASEGRQDEKTAGAGELPNDAECSAVEIFRGRSSNTGADVRIYYLSARPDIEAFIRLSVEATGRETSVFVCGGPSLVARARNCAAALSDESAVHKGTGAQGTCLFAEEYSF